MRKSLSAGGKNVEIETTLEITTDDAQQLQEQKGEQTSFSSS